MNQDQMMYSPPKYGGIINKKYIPIEDDVTSVMDPSQTLTHGGKYDPVLVVPPFDQVV